MSDGERERERRRETETRVGENGRIEACEESASTRLRNNRLRPRVRFPVDASIPKICRKSRSVIAHYFIRRKISSPTVPSHPRHPSCRRTFGKSHFKRDNGIEHFDADLVKTKFSLLSRPYNSRALSLATLFYSCGRTVESVERIRYFNSVVTRRRADRVERVAGRSSRPGQARPGQGSLEKEERMTRLRSSHSRCVCRSRLASAAASSATRPIGTSASVPSADCGDGVDASNGNGANFLRRSVAWWQGRGV